jgi:uncharacterized SAM-binding protein YcdF (DUF218 family)
MRADTSHAWLINQIIQFLAKRDIAELTGDYLKSAYFMAQADLLILLGNSSLYVAEQAALAYQHGLAKELMICGGIGHSTKYLTDNVRRHPVYADVEVAGKPEADILKNIFVKHWNILENEIILENQSTNCGSNAIEAASILTKLNKHPQSIILMQDPVLQLRTYATFRKVWQQDEVVFINYAAFIPYLTAKEGLLTYVNPSHVEFCEIDRLLSLVMGEIPRLKNDINGYGPRGKNFIVAMDIPSEIMEAYHKLANLYPNYIR